MKSFQLSSLQLSETPHSKALNLNTFPESTLFLVYNQIFQNRLKMCLGLIIKLPMKVINIAFQKIFRFFIFAKGVLLLFSSEK